MRHCTPHLQLLEEAGAAALQRQLEHLAAAGAAPAAEPGGTSSSEAGSSSRQQAQARAPSLSQLASLVWGMATLGHHPVRLLPLMPPALRCQDAPPSFTAVCTIAWSLAVAGCLQHPAADAVAAALANAAEGLASAGAKKAALLQLHQFCLALQLSAEQAGGVGGDGAGTALNLLRQHAGMQPLLAASATAWEAEGRYRGSKQVSAAQADVAATARGLGLAVQEELAVAGFSGERARHAHGAAVPLLAVALPAIASSSGHRSRCTPAAWAGSLRWCVEPRLSLSFGVHAPDTCRPRSGHRRALAAPGP